MLPGTVTPPVFLPGRPFWPLKRGIRLDLQSLIRPGFHATCDKWLAAYTRRREYLEMLARPGSRRYDLTGRSVEVVSESHREHARKLLAALKAKP